MIMPTCNLAAAATVLAACVACLSGVQTLPVAAAFVTTAPPSFHAGGTCTHHVKSAGAGRSAHATCTCASSRSGCLGAEGDVGSNGVGFAGDSGLHRRSFLADALTTIAGVACTCTGTAVAPALADDSATSAAAAEASGSVTGTGPAATYAYRSGGLPSLRPLGIGLLQRYEGYVEAPPASARKQLFVTFDFPSDWLQLDKLGGGVQYVDQRNGDKLYVLRARLPEGKSLIDVPKSFFAESIFDPRGDIVRSGTVVEGGKTSKSMILNDCTSGSSNTGTQTASECMNRRRLTLKYDTVTGSGVQTVERRALADAYEVDGDVYMLVTSSNAVKFEAKGKERDTVEAIVASFRVAI